METKKKDILCIGHITHDRIITPALPLGIDCAGGTAYYVAWAMSHLPLDGVSFGVVTAVGNDLAHEVERLRQAGIDIKAHQSPTSVYFENKYGLDMNDRTQRVLSKAKPFTIEQLSCEEADVFHLGTLLVDDFSPEVVEYLSERGRVSIDVQGYLREVRGEDVFAIDWRDKLAVLKHTDILKLNEHEMEVVTGLTNPREVARRIADWGVREVVITLGSYGSLIYADGHYYEIPAYTPRQAVDATGCGDTYSTGYLYCRAQGMNYLESGKFAAAMCTLKLEHSGPFDGSIDDIQRLVEAG